MLLNEDSESYLEFEEEERCEFLFCLFRHLCIGGQICQYEDKVNVYLDLTKALYKDLIRCVTNYFSWNRDAGMVGSLQRSERSRQQSVADIVSRVQSDFAGKRKFWRGILLYNVHCRTGTALSVWDLIRDHHLTSSTWVKVFICSMKLFFGYLKHWKWYLSVVSFEEMFFVTLNMHVNDVWALLIWKSLRTGWIS